MANISTITYNSKVIAETEEAGNVAVTYDGTTLATLSAGQSKTINCSEQPMKTDIVIGSKTLRCKNLKMFSDILIAVKSSFPAQPTSYTLISQYTSSTTFTAPEDGYFQIEVFGASHGGGMYAYAQADVNPEYYCFGGGGGGGGGGAAISRVKLKKGDKIAIVCGAVGSTSSATINSSLESYTKLQVTSATGGTDASADGKKLTSTAGVGGNGGTASGGNYVNANGGKGKNGTTAKGAEQSTGAVGGAGGTAGYTGGNVGGTGGSVRTWANFKTPPTSGSAGFIKVYRGNTNVTA